MMMTLMIMANQLELKNSMIINSYSCGEIHWHKFGISLQLRNNPTEDPPERAQKSIKQRSEAKPFVNIQSTPLIPGIRNGRMKKEEDHLDSLRDRLNIDGLTEEELVAYATLISKEANVEQ